MSKIIPRSPLYPSGYWDAASPYGRSLRGTWAAFCADRHRTQSTVMALHCEAVVAVQWCQVNDRRIFLTFNEFGIYGSDSPVSSVTSPFDARRFTDGPKGSRGLGLDGPGVKGSYPIRRAHERGITGSSEKPAYGLLWQSLLKWSAKPISEERLSDVHQSPTHFSTDR